jgi:hypothetical protein
VEHPFEVARSVAAQWAADLRGVLATVVPVAALFAETAETRLENADSSSLAALARLDADSRADLLFSPEDFLAGDLDAAERATRARLLGLLGTRGIASCLEWIDAGARGAVELADRLRVDSGVSELRALIEKTLAPQAAPLKASWGLVALESLAFHESDTEGARYVRRLLDAEREPITLDPEMHQLAEMRALRESQRAALPEELRADLLRVTGSQSVSAKLGCPEDADPELLQRTAVERAQRWATYAYGAAPLGAEIADVVRRSYTLLWEQASDATAAAS